jgi:hypothetical protein
MLKNYMKAYLFTSLVCTVDNSLLRRRAARYDDDPIIRSHGKSASVGMKGFYAGRKEVWQSNSTLYPEQDTRASTRDWEKTARQGEKALHKPYDNPRGTPKSWAIRTDVEPDNEDGLTRLGNRIIERGSLCHPRRTGIRIGTYLVWDRCE